MIKILGMLCVLGLLFAMCAYDYFGCNNHSPIATIAVTLSGVSLIITLINIAVSLDDIRYGG